MSSKKPNKSEMIDIIQDLVDPGDCWFDHHGYCQEHAWFSLDKKCPHARAKDLLDALRLPSG